MTTRMFLHRIKDIMPELHMSLYNDTYIVDSPTVFRSFGFKVEGTDNVHSSLNRIYNEIVSYMI